MGLGAFTNALANARGQSSLPAPATLNPLAAQGAAATVAEQMWRVRGAQAESAVGDALRAATGPDGVVDYPKFNSLIAQNAATSPAARSALTTSSTLTAEQMNQQSALMSDIHAHAAPLIKDPSDQNVNAIFDSMVAKQPSRAAVINSERQRVLAMTDPRQRQQYAYNVGVAALDGLGRLHTQQPSVEMGNFGGASAPVTSVPGGPGQPPTVSVGAPTYHAPGPGDTTVIPGVWVDKNGVPTNDPAKRDHQADITVPTRSIPGLGFQTPAPGTAPGPAPAQPPANPNLVNPGAPKGTQPGRVFPATPANPAVQPAPPAPAPATAAPAPAPTATPAPATAPAPAAPAPATPPVISSVPVGGQEQLNKDIELRTTASAATKDQRQNIIAGESALEALRLAKGYTGPGTATESRILSFMQANGIDRPAMGNMSPEVYRNLLVKNLLRFAQVHGQSAGTDLQLTKLLEGNPNADEMLPAANEHVLIQDIGIKRQQLAMNMLVPAASRDAAVAGHLKDYTGATDPRAFAIDIMSPGELKAVLAEVSRDPKAKAKWDRGVRDAEALGLLKPAATAPTTAAPPGPQGMLVPPNAAPPMNFAALGARSPNALLGSGSPNALA